MVMQRSTNFKNAVKSEEREDSEMSSFGIADSFLNSSNLMLSNPRKNLNRSQHSKISSDMKPATSRRDNRKGVRENILNNSVLNIILDDEN